MSREIQISLNLVQAAAKELDFLELMEQRPALHTGPHIKNAIRRYELFWLPLATRSYADEIAAPLDIAWVWHAHMLAPKRYEEDCTRVVSSHVDHKLMVGKKREKCLATAREIWRQLYPAEPFEVNLKLQPKWEEYESKIEYDLVSASERQRTFFYQVSLPHYRDSKFLKAAVERYKQHLLLKKRNPDSLLVPCYDFDLIWHAHQVHPLDYKEDLLASIGTLLDHDDSLTDRNPGSKLVKSHAETVSLWEKAGWAFPANGAMFRGVPESGPTGRSRAVGKYSAMASLDYEVELLNFEVEGLPEAAKDYVVELFVINGQHICKKKVRGPSGICKSDKPICKFKFNTECNTCIQVRIAEARRFGCFGEQSAFNISSRMYLTDKLDSVTYGSSTTQKIHFDDGKVVNFTIRVYPPKPGRFFFAVQTQRHFSQVQKPNYPAYFVPHVALHPVSPPPPCEMSLRRIFDYRNKEAFSYRVLHSAGLMLSSVEILDLNEKPLASAHLLSNEALPSKDQVAREASCCTLGEGERAMLVRGERDWGICVGRWEGFVSREPDDELDSVPSRGEPGSLEIKFFSLHKKSRGWRTVRRNCFTYHVTIPGNKGVEVNLETGTITFPPQIDDVPESLALGMAIAVLCLLCQPHPIRNPSLSSAPAVSTGDKLNKPRAIHSEDLLLVVAAGYFATAVPTNSFLSYTSGACAGCGGCGGC